MTTLPEVVLHLVDDLPEEHVIHLAQLLQTQTRLDWERLFQLLRTAVLQIDTQERVRRFIAEWRSLSEPPTAGEMALLLESVSAALAHQRQKQKVELTWTGPKTNNINLRRTNQALFSQNTPQLAAWVPCFCKTCTRRGKIP
jgi:hypothetical protein